MLSLAISSRIENHSLQFIDISKFNSKLRAYRAWVMVRRTPSFSWCEKVSQVRTFTSTDWYVLSSSVAASGWHDTASTSTSPIEHRDTVGAVASCPIQFMSLFVNEGIKSCPPVSHSRQPTSNSNSAQRFFLPLSILIGDIFSPWRLLVMPNWMELSWFMREKEREKEKKIVKYIKIYKYSGEGRQKKLKRRCGWEDFLFIGCVLLCFFL